MEVEPNKRNLSPKYFEDLAKKSSAPKVLQSLHKKIAKPETNSQQFERLLGGKVIPYSQLSKSEKEACKRTYYAALSCLAVFREKGKSRTFLRALHVQKPQDEIQKKVDALKGKLELVFSEFMKDERIESFPLEHFSGLLSKLVENSEVFTSHDLLRSQRLGKGGFGEVSSSSKMPEKSLAIRKVKKEMILSLVPFFEKAKEPIQILRKAIHSKEIHYTLIFLKPLFQKVLEDNPAMRQELKTLKANYEQKQLKKPLSDEFLNSYKEELTSDELFSFFLLAVKQEGLIEDKKLQEFFECILKDCDKTYSSLKSEPVQEKKLAVKKEIKKEVEGNQENESEIHPSFQEEVSRNHTILKHPNLATGKLSEGDEELLLPLASSSAEFYFDQSSNRTQQKMRPFFLDVLRGLTFLHDQNILHLDLAPRNILRRQKNVLDTYQITDFGLAHEVKDKDQTVRYQYSKGPVDTAPHELFTSKMVGAKSDVFMAGMLLQHYFILEGTKVTNDQRFRGDMSQFDDAKIQRCLGFNTQQLKAFKSLVSEMLAQRMSERPTAREAYFALRDIYAMDETKG